MNSTICVHAGGHPDKETGAIMPPIYQTSTYVQESPGVHRGYEYTRSHNPTRTRLEEALSELEGGKYALSTASGLSAEMLIMHSLEKGSKVLCGDDVYGGTYRLFNKVFSSLHDFSFVDTTNLNLVEENLKALRPAMLWLETPSNPLLKVTSLKEVIALAHKYQCRVVVDNTFLSPILQNPLKFGADIVLHSLTKYINGHSDVVGGAMMTNCKETYDKLFFLQNAIGPSSSPFDSWLVLRGIKTLSLRMKAHCENGLKVASFLEKHSNVEKVLYPFLPSHPQHSIAAEQMKGAGGMVTFFMKGGLPEARRFLEKCKIFSLAESLGGVESMVDHPAIMTHASIPQSEREKIGLTDNLVRLSVGIEDIDDILNDLDNALKK